MLDTAVSWPLVSLVGQSVIQGAVELPIGNYTKGGGQSNWRGHK